jgi:hypothetical protein
MACLVTSDCGARNYIRFCSEPAGSLSIGDDFAKLADQYHGPAWDGESENSVAINPLKPSGYITCINILEFFILSTQCVCAFRVVLTVNRSFFAPTSITVWSP